MVVIDFNVAEKIGYPSPSQGFIHTGVDNVISWVMFLAGDGPSTQGSSWLAKIRLAESSIVARPKRALNWNRTGPSGDRDLDAGSVPCQVSRPSMHAGREVFWSQAFGSRVRRIMTEHYHRANLGSVDQFHETLLSSKPDARRSVVST